MEAVAELSRQSVYGTFHSAPGRSSRGRGGGGGGGGASAAAAAAAAEVHRQCFRVPLGEVALSELRYYCTMLQAAIQYVVKSNRLTE